MGWLSVFGKHKGAGDSESASVRSAGKSGVVSGTGVMGDPGKGVVTAGGGSVNVVHSNGGSGGSGGGGGGGGVSNYVSSPRYVGTPPSVAPTGNPGGKMGSYIISPPYTPEEGAWVFRGSDLVNMRGCGSCGHMPTVAIVAGCWEGQHVTSWLSCRSCQLEILWQIRNAPGLCYMPCGHHWGDLIYEYLPNDSEFQSLGNRLWDVKSNIVY